MHQRDEWGGWPAGDDDVGAQVSTPDIPPGLRVVAAAILGSFASALIYAALALGIYGLVTR